MLADVQPRRRSNPFVFLFTDDAPVDRGTYLLVGVGLAALKYALEVGLIYGATGFFFTPLQYLSPLLGSRTEILGNHHARTLMAQLMLALPFIWVGLSMSARRARDAGISPYVALLFLVPGINYGLMLTLLLLPTHVAAEAPGRGKVANPPSAAPAPPAPPEPDSLRPALVGVAAGVGLAVAMTLFSTLVLGEYGLALFFITPALVGACTGHIYNRPRPRELGSTMMVAGLAVTIAGLGLLGLALEGAICLVMAAPLAIPMALLGAWMARAIAVASNTGGGGLVILAALLPVLTAVEAGVPAPLVEREVRTRVVIEATPEMVWSNVIGFVELEAPPSWIYSVGVAYPVHARIEGEGVGAIRHCEFSTGAFVEPITAWEPGRRLAFDVASQPPPMHEWSPYQYVHPPHLDGYMRSRRGEFRLRDLGDGRTELEGSTWYTLDLAPQLYWTLWSDALIGGIHQRVLAHVKTLSERGQQSVPSRR